MGEPAEKTSGNTRGNTGNLIPWKPGQSGNPAGRPKDSDRLAAYIRESTKGGREIADFMMGVMRGGEKLFMKGQDRIKAAEWLADRGFGKAKEISAISEPFPVNDLTDEELIVLQRVVARRTAATGGDPSGADPSKAS